MWLQKWFGSFVFRFVAFIDYCHAVSKHKLKVPLPLVDFVHLWSVLARVFRHQGVWIAESFYNVKYGLSIITSKVCQIISGMKTKTLEFSVKWYFKNSSFWHFNSCFVLKTTKTQVFVLITEIFWQTFWRNNWRSIIDVVERLCFWVISRFWTMLSNINNVWKLVDFENINIL